MPKKKSDSKAVIQLDQNSHMPLGFFRTRLIPKSDEELELLAEELLAWSQQDEAKALTQWINKKGFATSTLYEWAERLPEFKEAVKIATETIGVRREILGLENKMNATMVLQTMPMYSKPYRQMLKWKASLQKEQTNSNETKIVVIDRIPNSTMVPERQEATVKLKTEESEEL